VAKQDKLELRVTAVHGLALCGVCGTLFSWLLPWSQIERAHEIGRPVCRAPEAVPWVDSVHALIELL